MATVRPTVKDVARAIARLDEHADTPEKGAYAIDGGAWTREELRRSVADNLSYVIGDKIRLGNISKRDVSLMLASAGATPFTIEQHAYAIASYIRSNRFRDQRFSGTI